MIFRILQHPLIHISDNPIFILTGQSETFTVSADDVNRLIRPRAIIFSGTILLKTMEIGLPYTQLSLFICGILFHLPLLPVILYCELSGTLRYLGLFQIILGFSRLILSIKLQCPLIIIDVVLPCGQIPGPVSLPDSLQPVRIGL